MKRFEWIIPLIRRMIWGADLPVEVCVEAIGDEHTDVLFLVEKQHCGQVTDALVREPRRGGQLETLHQAKVGGVAQHVDVQKFSHITATPHTTHEEESRIDDSFVCNKNKGLTLRDCPKSTV